MVLVAGSFRFLALLLFVAGSAGAGSLACTLSSQLSTASLPWFGGRLVPISPNCALLGPDETAPIIVTSSLTLRGDSSGAGSLDAQYAGVALVASSPGVQIVIDTLRLYNVRMDPSSFLSLTAFNASTLRLSSVEIVTDCLTLSQVADASNVSVNLRGRGYLYVSRYTSAGVNATAVNITCALPAVERRADGDYVVVGDSTELFNAMFADQSSTAPLMARATTNLSMSAELWRPSRGLVLTRNVSLRGDLGRLNVMDMNCIGSAVQLPLDITFSISNFWVFNVGPLRGELFDLGMLPLFSLPVWFFTFTRGPNATQLQLTNVTLTLPTSEYLYFTMWTVVATTEVVQVSEAAAILKSTTSIIKLGVAPNRDSISFAQLRGTGIDMYNTSLTAVLPPGPFTSIVLDNPNLQFSLDVAPNLTQVPVYSLADMMALLQDMQDDAPTVGTALFILRNITIDPALWPADGYNISTPLLMVGQSNLGLPTWIDFRRVGRFVRAFGCAPSMYIYMQGLSLVNLPNAMLQPRGLPSGSAPAGSAESAATADVSIYMSNFMGMDTSCPTPLIYTNQSAVVITYSEYKRVYSQVAKSFGTTQDGEGVAVGSSFKYNLLTAELDTIHFSTVVGWGWSGYRINVTYTFPPNVPVLYKNVYEPPSPPRSPVFTIPPSSRSSGDTDLRGWHVALIVVGAVVLVALVAGLVAWRLVSRARREVEAVKGGEKRGSSSPSADNEVANGNANGVRLGSSNNGGGETAPRTLAVLKGSLGRGESGPGATPGSGNRGTSEDSGPIVDKPPLEVLNNMMTTLTREMNDQHLTILEVIGQGGFGVVYKGQWKGLNVAVKTITFQDRVAGGEKAQHRAILEAAISSSLAHPNVVTTFSYDIKPLTVQDSSSADSPGTSGTGGTGGGMGSTPGGNSGLRIIDKRTVLDWKLYLIQEYCDGGSLRTAILKRKFFDIKRGEPRMEMLFDTALELAGGLVHLHERNIIHGDLNPNNVLLKRDASRKYGAICKIADFGLSIRMNADQSHISNMRRGTPFYTCPQILSRGNMTKAADVYSMGVMLWEMYHCCMSYRSLPNGFAARENFPAFPRKAPHDFAQLVVSSLDPEPSARPTFTQLRSALEGQLAELKRGELRTCETALGPDPAGDAAHLAACQD